MKSVEVLWEIGNDSSTYKSQVTLGDWRKLEACPVGVVAGMTIADTVHVKLETSCLPSAGCNVWCRVVERYVALYSLVMLLMRLCLLLLLFTSAVASAAVCCSSVFGSGAMSAGVLAVAACTDCCMWLHSFAHCRCSTPYALLFGCFSSPWCSSARLAPRRYMHRHGEKQDNRLPCQQTPCRQLETPPMAEM
jgi:hypothetical protein